MTWLFSEVKRFQYRIIKRAISFLRRVLPGRMWHALRSLLHDRIRFPNFETLLVAEWLRAREKHPWIPGSKEFGTGINLVGFLRTAKGIAEAARSSILALEAAKIPYSTIDYGVGAPSPPQIEVLFNPQHEKGFQYNATLFHINPPQLPRLWETFKKRDLTGRYHIGVWYWELPTFPDDWQFAFGLVDEVWAATQFVLDCISAKSPVPVVKIPPCIHTVYDPRLKRSDFNLPKDGFLFLCAYDVLSTQARKNPLGAIEAFQRAFPPNDPSVGLVLKINNAHQNPDEIRLLHEKLRGYSNCYFIEEVLEKPIFNALLNLVDTYVSLHRSEGFGLISAEAMSLGKPVIMTRWSGNVDLMTADNSCGVDYTLVPVREKVGPYLPGQIWADPDLDQAACFMQKLRSDRAYYEQISEHAQIFIRDYFSPEIIGQLVKDRMRQIGLIL